LVCGIGKRSDFYARFVVSAGVVWIFSYPGVDCGGLWLLSQINTVGVQDCCLGSNRGTCLKHLRGLFRNADYVLPLFSCRIGIEVLLNRMLFMEW